MDDAAVLMRFEELEADLHRAVGRMVASWSQLEGWLAHTLNLLLVKSGSGRQGETIYYEVPNLNPRIAMLKAAFFNDSDIAASSRDKWESIIDAVEREAPERNAIIHGDFIRGTAKDDEPAVAVSPRIFSDIRRLRPPPGASKLGFDTADIQRHTERVGFLRDALWALYVELPYSRDAAPPMSTQEYLEAWRTARGRREWPSVRQ